MAVGGEAQGGGGGGGGTPRTRQTRRKSRPAAMSADAPLPLYLSFGISATAACLSEILTLPLDTAKVRLQLQSLACEHKGQLKYNGPLHTIRTMIAEEGVLSLFNGLTPGLHRQFLFTGLRLGLYDKLKETLNAHEITTLGQRIGLAVLTSALAITVANPSDVLKVRYQAHNPTVPVKRRKARAGAFRQYVKISQSEGVVNGLYKGFAANLLRNSIISASEITSYEIAKKNFIEHLKFEDGIPVHLASGCTAGFVATVLGSPADVLGTKAMQKHGHYSGLTASQIAYKMAKNEGVLSFYKGFWPNFCRIGSFNIAMWFFYEQIKSKFRIDS